jgi:outer membrane protein OmpA-like peptidoglycan-associated protein
MRTFRSIGIWAIGIAGIAACAVRQPPQDLVSARAAYDRASKGPAAAVAPRDMDAARKQLDMAEASFDDDGDTQGTRDQAYLALRKAEYAEVIARTLQSDQATGATVDAMHADEKKTVAGTAAALSRTKSELASQETANAAQKVENAHTKVALKDEKARREEAEKRAQQAAADLAKFASVKQEPRGMVITLSGSVLFASAKWDLLPAAQLKLNDVANALTKEDPLSKIVVEGHTDSQGQPDYNQELSQHRAQVVRDYLVTRGIAGDRIVAQGFGPTRTIADNKSPEGRANNRRVEIVVQPSPAQ